MAPVERGLEGFSGPGRQQLTTAFRRPEGQPSIHRRVML
jgi:hypothetical protein